jgi:hypothetical protein
MALLFHQNMRVFGGGSAPRNAVFTGALTAINAATGAAYWAAGFTEITNPNAPLRGVLAGLAATLDPGLTSLVVIEVGTTALGMREYIGIVWDNAAFPVAHVGRVLRDPVNRAWAAYNVAAAAIPANRVILLPGLGAPLAADSRGVAYIAGTNGGTNYLLGFMHNMYALGDKSGAYVAMPSMTDLARAGIGGAYAAAEVIVGGDFNLDPRPPKRPRGAAFLLYPRAEGGPGAYTNTTLANPYDFWLVSNVGITDADDTVYPATRVAAGSDHAAVVLTR